MTILGIPAKQKRPQPSSTQQYNSIETHRCIIPTASLDYDQSTLQGVRLKRQNEPSRCQILSIYVTYPNPH